MTALLRFYLWKAAAPLRRLWTLGIVHLWLPVKRWWTGDHMIGMELMTGDGDRFVVTGTDGETTLTVRGLRDGACLSPGKGTVTLSHRP